MYIEMYYIRLA